jgi:alanyl-tRNA synthetase
MLTRDIRQNFLNYFQKHQHSVIPSSAVIPHDDPTLLFTNAGMNQFKDVFLGRSHRDYTRATTSQKCIRVGGKHNDLENVGHTSRHLTFFEMLGNFSFGDYFKKDAIKFAWEVSTEVFGFDPERIWPTVFREDDEAFELWTQYVPAARITRFDEKDNFWAMGETGPCGPCSELLYDKGAQYGTGTKPVEDPSGERFLEFWNLVFMQFNKDASGVSHPLPRPSIDTGAGLERVLSLKMGVDSVFETDILRGLINQVEIVSGVPYNQHDPVKSPAFRVIADHLRCLAFAIADGVQPSNLDRGYVLRKILRRAVRYGRQLGMENPFLAQMMPRLLKEMGDDYPELIKSEHRIAEILTLEEESFIRTLRRGGNMLNQIMERSVSHAKVISGDDAFKLKDTYGFPLEEIQLLAKDADLTVDTDRYEVLEKEAKERSRSSQKVVHQIAEENTFASYLEEHGPTAFTGYNSTKGSSKITALWHDGASVEELHEGQEGMVLLAQTPFYAEMGGQIGDSGQLANGLNTFKVSNTTSPFKGISAHHGNVTYGTLKVGDVITAEVDENRRQQIANHHTATHLLHWALHKVLGEHVKQAGSVVEHNRLRFDFSHHKSVTPEEIRQIEDLINDKIRHNTSVKSSEIPYQEAQKRPDIKQFFGEKYGSIVRVVDIGGYSAELCGGTHTSALGTLGLFKITKESSIAAGVRRIEAVTAAEAERVVRETEDLIEDLSKTLKTPAGKLTERIEKLLEENKKLASDLKELRKGEITNTVKSLSEKVEIFGSKKTPFVAAEVTLSPEDLRTCAEELYNKFSTGLIVLATAVGTDKCHLFGRGEHAQDVIKAIAPIVEGSGGGKPTSAQAGGKTPQKIGEALIKAKELFQNYAS